MTKTTIQLICQSPFTQVYYWKDSYTDIMCKKKSAVQTNKAAKYPVFIMITTYIIILIVGLCRALNWLPLNENFQSSQQEMCVHGWRKDWPNADHYNTNSLFFLVCKMGSTLVLQCYVRLFFPGKGGRAGSWIEGRMNQSFLVIWCGWVYSYHIKGNHAVYI